MGQVMSLPGQTLGGRGKETQTNSPCSVPRNDDCGKPLLCEEATRPGPLQVVVARLEPDPGSGIRNGVAATSV